ncbi:efflux RND transporter periplasmic adaptor subunit [Brevibacillus sp. FIR094]|uniref:efflux RND transporter periplasmic adaptor subunit n=1 Tax=Brevibacillus sp. FIR094 TaxID=3134809 RepID=UPI003D1D65E1
MKKQWRFGQTACLFLMIGLMVTGCSGEQDTSEPVKPVAAVPVTIQIAKEGSLSADKSYIGSIVAQESGNVVTKAAGTVTRVYVRKGDLVKKGQLIAELDNTKQQLDLKEAQAKLESATARLEQAKAGQSMGDGKIASAESLAEESLAHARESYERVKKLVDAGALPVAQLTSAEEDWIRAQNAYRTTNMADFKDEAGISIAEADVKIAKIAVEKAAKAQSDTKVTATMDGTINQLLIAVGDVIAVQGKVAELVSLNKVKVAIEIPEDSLVSMQKGRKVRVSVPSAGLQEEGEISFVGVGSTPDVKAYPVEIVLGNPAGVMRPGMRADVFVNHTETKKGSILPMESLIEKGEKQFVFVIKEGKAIEQEVQVLESNANTVLIGQGLNAGDAVVVSGHDDLQDGIQVSIIQNNEAGEPEGE